jgi:hypothetical protein
MSRTEILERFETLKTPAQVSDILQHPAYDLFVECMADKQYGAEPLSTAWEWFASGWDAA